MSKLTSAIFPYHSEWFFETMAFRGGLATDRIKSLAININYFRAFGAYTMFLRYLPSYSSLEQIILFVEEKGGSGEMRFVEVDNETDEGLLWKFAKEIKRESSGWKDGGREGPREACERITSAVWEEWDDVRSDEEHDDHEFLVDWELPDLRVAKLTGTIEGQVLRDRAEEKGWWKDG